MEAPALPPEINMLLCCARTSVSTECADHIKQLVQSNLDWNILIQSAEKHCVLPLLYRSLQDICPKAVPQTILEQLHHQVQSNSLQAFHLTQGLLDVLESFHDRKLPVIPIKGPILAITAYGDVTLRRFGDLDLLVEELDFKAAQKLLRKQGFTQYDEMHENGFIREEDQIEIDLQWCITARYFPFQPCFAELYQRLLPITLAGRTVHSLAPEDTLLVLCVHGSKHCWERLQWICDVAELLRAYPELDWDYVLKQASSLHCMRMLALGVRLANELLAAPLPENLSTSRLADPVAKKLVPQIVNWLFVEPDGIPAYESFERHKYFLNLREHLSDKMMYSLHLVRHAPTFHKARWFIPLPALISLSYYLLLLPWLVVKYGLRPFINLELNQWLYSSKKPFKK